MRGANIRSLGCDMDHVQELEADKCYVRRVVYIFMLFHFSTWLKKELSHRKKALFLEIFQLNISYLPFRAKKNLKLFS